jgi:hypothetical protein
LDAERRCVSIERLEGLSDYLDSDFVEGLIRDDVPLVARFALGLVPLTRNSKALFDSAKEGSQHLGDPKYVEELGLLEQMVSSTVG